MFLQFVVFELLNFEFVSDFDIRISDFSYSLVPAVVPTTWEKIPNIKKEGEK
jgi:hypothetical protein